MGFVNVPNGSNVFPDLVGIRRLKLRQLRVSLDFEEDFLSGGRQNLDVDRQSTILRFRLLVFGLVSVGHGSGVISRVWRV